MIEYIVENQLVELGEESVIELHMSMNDIRNPITFNNTWSKQIDIPGTPNNNKIFNHIYENNIEVGYDPNIKKNIEIRINSIPIIIGYQKINDIYIEDGRITYKVVIYGNNTTIFEDMGDNLITDLIMSEHNHLFTKENVENSWSGTTGYYYPFINYNDQKWGWDQISGSTDDFTFLPSFQVKTIIDKIFDTYGYTYDSNFFNSNLFKSLYIPYTNAFTDEKTTLIESSETYQLNFEEDENTQQIYGVQEYHLLSKTDPLNIYNVGTHASKIRTPGSGIWTLNVSGSTMTGSTNYFFGADFYIYSQRQDIPNQPFTLEYQRTIHNSDQGSQVQVNFDFNFTFPTILKDRDLFIFIDFFNSGQDGETFGMSYTTKWELQTDRFFYNLTNVKPNESLPKVKQKDLFDVLNKMFNLYVERNPDDPFNLIIEPFEQYYERSTGAYDWTYKVDVKTKKYKLMSELNSNSFKFKYRGDTDFLNKTYTENVGKTPGEITTYVQTNFTKDDKVIELPASPTIIENFYNDLIFPSFVKDPNTDKPTINTKWNWRILSRNLIPSDNFTYNSKTYDIYPTLSHIYGYGSNTKPYTSLWFDSGDQNFTWDQTADTIYELYWEKYLDLIKNQNSKLLTIDTYLSEKDISNLRFYERIFILDNYYYLNKIIFNPLSKKSQSELLLIPSTDIRYIFFNNLRITEKYPYIQDTEITIYVDVSNFSQNKQSYSGYFYMTDSSGDITEQFNVSDYIIKNNTITLNQSVLLKNYGNIKIGFTDGNYFDENITIFVSKNPYIYDNLRTESTGQYTGFQVDVKFDIQAVEPTHNGTTSGDIYHVEGDDLVPWTWTSSGLGQTTITKSFNFVNGKNTFIVSGDWTNQIIVYAVDPQPFISDGGWTLTPSTLQQGDNVEVKWRLNNTGQIPAENVQVTFKIRMSDGVTTIPNYPNIVYTGTTLPLGHTDIYFTLNNLPFNEPDSTNDIYSLTNLYVYGETSYVNGFTTIPVNPCVDDIVGQNLTIYPTNVTGDTTSIVTQYDILNNSCKAVLEFDWSLKYEYYSVQLDGVKKYTPVYTHTGFLPSIPGGSSITIPTSYTSYKPPNTWTDGIKTMVIKGVNPFNQSFPLQQIDYNYYVGQPNIVKVSSEGLTSNNGLFWLSLTAQNIGNSTGSGYITAVFKRPNTTTIQTLTTPTYEFTTNQTRTITTSAYAFTSDVYGTYSIEWSFRKSPGGTILFSGTEYVYRPEYVLNIDENDRIVWSGGGTHGGTKTFNINIKLSTSCWGEIYQNGMWFAQAFSQLYNGSTMIGEVTSYCEMDTMGQTCQDNDTQQFTIYNVSLGDTSTGSTSISFINTIFCEMTQFGASAGQIELEIMSITKTDGDIGIVKGSNYKKIIDCI